MKPLWTNRPSSTERCSILSVRLAFESAGPLPAISIQSPQTSKRERRRWLSIEAMPEILIASLSPVGHIGPLLNVAQGLVNHGDRVTVLSSAQHAARIRAVGA